MEKHTSDSPATNVVDCSTPPKEYVLFLDCWWQKTTLLDITRAVAVTYRFTSINISRMTKKHILETILHSFIITFFSLVLLSFSTKAKNLHKTYKGYTILNISTLCCLPVWHLLPNNFSPAFFSLGRLFRANNWTVFVWDTFTIRVSIPETKKDIVYMIKIHNNYIFSFSMYKICEYKHQTCELGISVSSKTNLKNPNFLTSNY